MKSENMSPEESMTSYTSSGFLRGYKEKPKRPAGVTILSILAIIGGLLSIFSLTSYISFSAFLDLSFPLHYLMFLGIIGAFMAALFFLIAYGFWKGLRWSWFLAIILLIIGFIMQIVTVSLVFFMLSMAPFSGTFDLFYSSTIIRVAISLVIYGVIIFYLTRSHVKTYFGIGQLGDITSTVKRSKRTIVLIVSVFAVIVVILVWGFIPTGEIKVTDLSISPENPQSGDEITLTAEITGGSPFGGAGASISYSSYFEGGSGSGSRPMNSVGDNKYTATFYGSNGTEIWCFIVSGNNVLAEYTIQVGHVERSDISSLVITNIKQTPENPTSATTSVEITADITSNVNVTDVEFMKEIFHASGARSGGGGSMWSSEDDTYSYTIYPYGGGLPFGSLGDGDGYQNQKFESGTKVYYRIAAKDELGNTAVITRNFTIS